jgi:hypothetical protein
MRSRTLKRGASLISPVSESPIQAAPQYVLYSFRKDEISKGSPVWQIEETLDDEELAMIRARTLYNRRDVTRVEVRRRALSAEGVMDDQSIHIIGNAPRRIRDVVWMMCAAFTCIAAAGFIALYR